MIEKNGHSVSYVGFGGRDVAEVWYGDHKVWPDGPIDKWGKWLYVLLNEDGGQERSGSTPTCASVPDGVIKDQQSNILNRTGVDTIYIGACATEIAERAFYGGGTGTTYNITVKHIVESPDATFEKIGGYAFWNLKNLESVNLPSVKEIGESAFHYCTALTDVRLDGLERIESENYIWEGKEPGALCHIAAEEITLPNLRYIHNPTPFGYNDKLKRVNFPKLETLYTSGMFSRSKNIEIIDIPAKKIVTDNYGIFGDPSEYRFSNLKEVHLDNVVDMEFTFVHPHNTHTSDAPLPDILTMNSLTAITVTFGSRPSYKNAIKGKTVEMNSLKEITGNYVAISANVCYMRKLERITNDITIYGTDFATGGLVTRDNCSLFLGSTPPSVESINTYSRFVVYVPDDAYDAYMSDEKWSKYEIRRESEYNG